MKLIALLLAVALTRFAVAADGEKPNQKKDCEKLLAKVMPLIEQLLQEQGGFLPVGCYMKTTGEIGLASFRPENDRPTPIEMIEGLRGSLSAMAAKGEIKAAAIFWDIRTIPPGKTEKQDAIAAAVEHLDQFEATVITPYTLKKGEKPKLEPSFVTPKKRDIFKGPDKPRD